MVSSAIALGAGLVAGLAGLGNNSQTLTHLLIKPMTLSNKELKPWPAQKEIEVPFNPNAYTIRKSVSWQSHSASSSTDATAGSSAATGSSSNRRALNAPVLEFRGGGSRSLTLELFFDVTEPVIEKGKAVPYKDVRKITNKFVELTRLERTAKPQQPPICEVSWGTQPEGSDFPFQGVITNLTQNFTLFKSDGTPVRARLTVEFTEWLHATDDQKETDPEETTYTVKRGDTLSWITTEVYGDPTLWRRVAEANQLDNPRELEIGKLLNIPDLP